MKKQESKKLSLNRETVRHLEAELKDVVGGIVSSDNRQCTYSQKCQTYTYTVITG